MLVDGMNDLLGVGLLHPGSKTNAVLSSCEAFPMAVYCDIVIVGLVTA